MADALVIYDGPGPLPVSVDFESPTDGSAVFVLSGTGLTASSPVLIGISLNLDGTGIGKDAVCWANQNNNHQTMRTTFIPYDDLSIGNHTIEIANATADTITDQNDYFQVTLLY